MKRLSFEFRFEIPHHWKCLGLQLATHSEELSAGFDECVELSPCLLITTLKKKKKKESDPTIPAIFFSFCCFPLATGAYSFSETQKLVSQATAEPFSMQGDSLIRRDAPKGG